MIRNLKALGLAALAAMALSAVVASTASAQFEAEGSGTIRTTPSANNTQTFRYTSGGFAVNCTGVGGSGTGTAPKSTTATFSPTYSGCSTILGTADVTFNKCHYKFTSAAGSTSISSEITCETGGSITITVTEGSTKNSICTLSITTPQTPGGTITGSNIGSGTTREIKIASNVTGIKGDRTGSSLCGPESSTTGTYTGEVTTTGENPETGAHVGIWMD